MAERIIPTPAQQPGDFNVGSTLNTALDVFSRNFVRFVLITMAVSLPSLILNVSGARVAAAQQATPGVIVPGFWPLVIESSFLGFLTLSVSQSLVFYLAFEGLRHRPARLDTSIKPVLSRLLPLIITLIFLYIFVTLASVLLIVPGVIVALMAAVALPVCLIEKRGPIASFRRSAGLTKRRRWKILGTFLVPLVGGGIATYIITSTVKTVVGPELVTIINLPFSAIFSSFFAVLSAVLYYDLVRITDGLDTGHIAAVFD